MPATVILDPVAGPIVVARLSEWRAAGRFLHAGPRASDPDPALRLVGHRDVAEAERLAALVNARAAAVARAAWRSHR